jgi:hypothetical protein
MPPTLDYYDWLTRLGANGQPAAVMGRVLLSEVALESNGQRASMAARWPLPGLAAQESFSMSAKLAESRIAAV